MIVMATTVYAVLAKFVKLMMGKELGQYEHYYIHYTKTGNIQISYPTYF